MNIKTEILNVPIDVVTRSQALDLLLTFLMSDWNHVVYTPNPEMVMEAQRDEEFMKVLKSADLVIPDGIGIVLASKLNRRKIKERVPGCDLIESLFEHIKTPGTTVYLLGGKPGVCELAKKNIEKKHPLIKIVGYNNGYFNGKEEKIIIKQIQNLRPDILLVGLGFPRQEKWLYTHRKRLPVKISAGVGGSIDIMAGTVKRAPDLFQKLGLEWFYRLLKQPERIVRMLQIPVFAFYVIKNKCKRN